MEMGSDDKKYYLLMIDDLKDENLTDVILRWGERLAHDYSFL